MVDSSPSSVAMYQNRTYWLTGTKSYVYRNQKNDSKSLVLVLIVLEARKKLVADFGVAVQYSTSTSKVVLVLPVVLLQVLVLYWGLLLQIIYLTRIKQVFRQ
jgi:hypothetical protein